MASNTYDTIPADRVEVSAEGTPQPSPEVLGDKSAARCVWSDILKPIASDPMSPVLRYLGTRAYHAATGSELRKTYADGSSTVKTYDAFNRLSTETSARGLVAAYAYETARGLLTGISYSDTTPGIAYSYNHLGMLTQVTDAAGTRSLGYNAYNEPETDSLVAGEKTHLITELRDSLGRSVGYTYAKDGAVQQTAGTSYGTDGRITGAGFLHGGELKEFTYTYVTGSHLLQGLAMPNNMALSLSYETQRDLMTGMVYTRGTTTVVQRGYSYDALGRPLTRTQSRQGGMRNDSFTHNDRSELTAATLGTDAYAYAYDNIGNRLTAQEAEEQTAYTTNNLNQYTAIQEGEAEAFAPTYDADGNQTLVKTSTGIWSVTYNAANRPVVFENEATGTVVECSYDSSGRRATKKVTVNGTVTLHQRYIYRGYLQIACCDLTRTAHPCLWLITWDPTQPIATRPLAIQKDGTWYTYGFDLTKNVTEVFTTTGYIGTAYTYTPYGAVSASGNVTQPIQWSSECFDEEINIYYYNYRYYITTTASWNQRDFVGEDGEHNIYKYTPSVDSFDYLGLKKKCQVQIIWGHGVDVDSHIEKHHKKYDPKTTAFGPFGCKVHHAPRGYQIPGFPDLSSSILGRSRRATNAGKNAQGADKEDASKGFVEVFIEAYNAAKAEAKNICKNSSCSEVILIFKGIGARSNANGGTEELRKRLRMGKFKNWNTWSSYKKENINCQSIRGAIKKENEMKKMREKAKPQRRGKR